MKIFLSWSGSRSRAVAEALNDWLRRIIQAVKPFYSPDIEKGAKWGSEIDEALAGTHFGIVCLTPDNLQSTWIHFETGALSKTKDALIWTFLHGLTPGDVPPPLGKFQHTVANKKDTLFLIKTINARLGEVGGEPLTEKLLEENFETFWPQLESRLKDAEKLASSASGGLTTSGIAPRDDSAILKEILELVRNQERRLKNLEVHTLASRRRKWPIVKEEKPRLCKSLRIRIKEESDPEAGDPVDGFIQSIVDVSPNATVKKIPVLDDAGTLLDIKLDPAVTEGMIEAIVENTTPSGTHFLITGEER